MDLKAIADSALSWVSGVFNDPNGTAARYEARHATWQQTAAEVTVPVNLVVYVAGFLLLAVFASIGLGFFGAVLSLLWAVAMFALSALVFDVMAGVFGGTRSFDQSFAMLTLAGIPAAIGSLFQVLPWIGWLIALVAAIYSLVLVYRFVPIFLKVPQEKRAFHFIASILVSLLVAFMGITMIGSIAGPKIAETLSEEETDDYTMFGGLGRQANFLEQAEADTYTPPRDGKLTDRQMRAYVDTLKKTNELRGRLGKKWEGKTEENTNLGDIFGGIGDMARLGTAEMEVVKTGGGNWAEHQWVRGQIEIARVQRDINEAVAHNYALFLKHQDEIERWE